MKEITLFEKLLPVTPIVRLSGDYGDNHFYMKRDDMLPFSFGNKVRKAAEFYREIKNSDTDVVMTYGSNSSNHCRIIANMAASMGLACHVISPEENRERLYNTAFVEQFGAVIETCPVTKVAETIENRKAAYRQEGKHPYFITGGGHGNPGTESYVKVYREICACEKESGIHFDYIFHGDRDRQIVGISIAREQGRGRTVVKDSIREYLGGRFAELYREDALLFTDEYRFGGYGNYSGEVLSLIDRVMEREGIPMDTTYVGKAFYGMCAFLKEHDIKDKKVLFIHTGGTPLYFDLLLKTGRR